MTLGPSLFQVPQCPPLATSPWPWHYEFLLPSAFRRWFLGHQQPQTTLAVATAFPQTTVTGQSHHFSLVLPGTQQPDHRITEVHILGRLSKILSTQGNLPRTPSLTHLLLGVGVHRPASPTTPPQASPTLPLALEPVCPALVQAGADICPENRQAPNAVCLCHQACLGPGQE